MAFEFSKAAKIGALSSLALASATTAQDFQPSFQLNGLVEGRFVLSDNERSVFDGGFGKLRYGGSETGSGQERFEFGEATLSAFSQLTPSLSLVATGQFNPDLDTEFDITEAFLRFRPVSTSKWRYSAKLGAFFPRISFENEGIGWSNTFTITNSAANTWFAEEFRPVGLELKAELRGETTDIEFTGSVFFANDRSGVALALRGFTLNDTRIGLFGSVAISDLTPGRIGEENSPFVESDGRPGFSLGTSIFDESLGEFSLYVSDNRGDVTTVGSAGRVWDTRFINALYSKELNETFFVGAQLFWGDTVTAPTGVRTDVLGTEFFSVSALISAELGPFAITVRPEFFDQNDLTTLAAPPDFNEDGFALTISTAYFVGEKHQFNVEYVYVDSDRNEGTDRLPLSQRENLLMANYRLTF